MPPTLNETIGILSSIIIVLLAYLAYLKYNVRPANQPMPSVPVVVPAVVPTVVPQPTCEQLKDTMLNAYKQMMITRAGVTPTVSISNISPMSYTGGFLMKPRCEAIITVSSDELTTNQKYEFHFNKQLGVDQFSAI